MKSTYPEGCRQFGKVVYAAYDRPNHASLFCQRIKRNIEKVSDNTFPSKGASTETSNVTAIISVKNLTNVVNIKLTNQNPVKINRIKRMKYGKIKN